MSPFKDRKNPWNRMEEAGCWPEYECGAPSGMQYGGPEGSYFISLVEAYPSPSQWLVPQPCTFLSTTSGLSGH